jgi:hypothetical protein
MGSIGFGGLFLVALWSYHQDKSPVSKFLVLITAGLFGLNLLMLLA